MLLEAERRLNNFPVYSDTFRNTINFLLDNNIYYNKEYNEKTYNVYYYIVKKDENGNYKPLHEKIEYNIKKFHIKD